MQNSLGGKNELFRSLKFQIFFALFIFILLLVVQTYLSRQNQARFLDGISLSQQTVNKVNLVGKLEKDVLDLQRYVLIFKQTASNSILKRFEDLYVQINNNLNKLESLVQDEDNVESYLDLISRMHSHLHDYKNNFETVVAGRSRRDAIIRQDINQMFSRLEQAFSSQQTIQSLTSEQRKSLIDLGFNFSQARISLLNYLLEPEPLLIAEFQQRLDGTRQHLQGLQGIPAFKDSIERELNLLSNGFVQLTQVTRGYLFLANVVMAGSANEFLYLAQELNQLVDDRQQAVDKQIVEESTKDQVRLDFFAGITLLLFLGVAIFFIYRVALPINTMTDLFKMLANQDDIERIPLTHRKDEIGQLAKAAEVFHDKNLQTNHLLLEAKKHNAQQTRLNQELATSTLRAKQAANSKSIFLANMSHEIRTPMNGISGLVELVLKTELTKEQREYLQKVSYSTQILMTLINDILDFSKIEAGKLDLENIRFSPESMFENLLGNISIKAKEKNLNIQFIANPKLPATIIGDPLRISQVLLNLCTNAVKFTRNGTVRIEVDFKPISPSKIALKIAVIDTGIGMEPEQLDKVFAPFTQADGSTSREFGGTGLGLSIVKQLVELMNGTISVDSTRFEGTRFDVKLELDIERMSESLLTFDYPVELFLLSTSKNHLVPQSYAMALHEKYRYLNSDSLELCRKPAKEQAILLIEVDDIKAHKALQADIQRAIEWKVNIGLVTNTQPNTLPSLLAQKWQVPVLSHPFSGVQFRRFIEDVLDIEHESDEELIEKEKQNNIMLKGHVLLVEDNHINQIVAGQMLKNMNITYDIAEDGIQAVTKIKNSPHYDLVLMDIQMPKMDGYEATKMIRDQGFNDVVICGLSANAMQSDYTKAFDVGMNDYITKPIKHIELLNMLAKYLPEKTPA
ncbi:ATP-binding protein [Aliiglaciecola litoralis]|uniref:histidine kinase n=1 Tax=Aliiglaciecola litoralis TaxID=582857 RepID=A0ABN1LGG4_9ALTE